MKKKNNDRPVWISAYLCLHLLFPPTVASKKKLSRCWRSWRSNIWEEWQAVFGCVKLCRYSCAHLSPHVCLRGVRFPTSRKRFRPHWEARIATILASKIGSYTEWKGIVAIVVREATKLLPVRVCSGTSSCLLVRLALLSNVYHIYLKQLIN